MDKDRISILIHADGHITSFPPNDIPDSVLEKMISIELVQKIEKQIKEAEKKMGIGEKNED